MLLKKIRSGNLSAKFESEPYEIVEKRCSGVVLNHLRNIDAIGTSEKKRSSPSEKNKKHQMLTVIFSSSYRRAMI